MTFRCPVCGYPYLREEPHPAGGIPSTEICLCCGFQFGYDDDAHLVRFREYREEWVRRGMRWFTKGIDPPPDYDAGSELSHLIIRNDAPDLCPACGYRFDPSSVCPCCGFDRHGERTPLQCRRDWSRDSHRWHSTTQAPPPDWDAWPQLTALLHS